MRVITSKSKNSESFYINFSYVNAKGKNTSKVYKKLGTLKDLSKKLDTDRDGVMAWAKEQARIETEKYNKEQETISIPYSPSQLIDMDKDRLFNCGYLFLRSIMSNLRFDNICRNIKNRHDYTFNLEAILSDLVYSLILSPFSKRSTYEYAHTLIEKPKYDIQHVYRALSVIAQESDYIQSEVYKNSNFVHNRNTKVLYYDCTNYFFEIVENAGLKQYGKSKENRANPIIGMGLFMDCDGIPLAFDLYARNRNEQTTLKPLEQKIIRDFECSEFVYCSDSGLASQDNKLFNNFGGRSYVITQSLKKLKKEDREIALNTKQYRKVGSNEFIDLKDLDENDNEVFNSIYYKEIPLSGKKVNETLIVTYSIKHKKYQAKVRQKQIDSLKNDDVVIELIQDAMYDGFYGVTTNIDNDINTIATINKRRWEIDEYFQIMKIDFEAGSVYLQREDKIKAHFLTCFLSLLVCRLLESKLEYKYTIDEILKTLRNMKLCVMEGYGYIPTYKRTVLTDALHNLVDYRTDTQIIKKTKMRDIIRQSNK